MKVRIFLSFIVLLFAIASAYFDAGALGTGIGMATLFPFISLEFGGEDNLPGIARGYLVRVLDIDVEAKPSANPATDLEKLQIVGSHQLVSGKYWAKIYSTLGKGNLKYENEGTRDFENFKTTGILFYPSTRKEAIAMSSAILGQDLMLLLEENSESAYYLQVGTRKLPARVVSAGDWGTELNGEKGITFNIEAFHGKKPVFFYDGLIPLSADTDANESPFS